MIPFIYKIIEKLRRWRAWALAYPAFAISFLRSPSQILEAWPQGEISLGPRVAVFVHFDRRGRVRPYVLHYLRELHGAGVSTLFVTNSGLLRPDAMEALKAVCAGVLVRRNIGYDFGAMREGLEYLKLPRPNTEMVLVLNDSVYGPLRPLEPVLNRIDFTKADVWGATESWQTRYHMQSFFLAFGRAALQSPGWARFWRQVRPVKSKHWVINHYEVGLTQALLSAGLRCAALWPYGALVKDVDLGVMTEGSEVDAAREDPFIAMRRAQTRRIRDFCVLRVPLNPTADLWRQLLRSGFPFIKRELLRDNPTGVIDLADWREIVTGELGFDPVDIDRDLQVTLRNRSP
jgi:hypothetical protein